MTNLFTDLRNKEPEFFYKGDTVIWERNDIAVDYPTASYSMSWKAILEDQANTSFVATVTETSNGYKFTIDNSVTTALTEGIYHWVIRATQTSDSETLIIDTGYIEVKYDAFDHAGDTRSHAKIMLSKIESLLQGKADHDVTSYSIGNRSLSKMSPTELVQWRDYYRAEVNRELRKERIDRGEGTGNTIKVRFDGNSGRNPYTKYGTKFNW